MNGHAYHTTPRVAIVTGASKGIGHAIALRLADDGLDVTINSRNAAELELVAAEIRAKGRKVLAFVGDVSDGDVVKGMVDRTVEVLGRLDVMVANAGIFVSSRVVDMDIKDWNRCMDCNLASTMLCYKYAARQMIEQGEGGESSGRRPFSGKRCPDSSAYVATKFAIRGLTQCLAIELAPHNITVNTYAPGVILTPMTDFGALDQQYGGGPGAYTKHLAGIPPDGPHSASGEPVASVVSYLAKPEAYFITGQSIVMDGGVVFS
ncbi:NAD(P)-binding protein [Fomitopsis serialis]|uniref:NAD(P)-binding protein n=1 Tax=Fomitopsis serialis TaxID=139415 RepID=UPI002007FFF9|nr:NAD(P)-binding protein [Neoantrodia serialis]KAH9932271.1 NAD(P)-binding protein [Neoantrodia serialis]